MKAAGRRQKGSRRERELVALLRTAGIPAERVPLSGAAGGSYSGDVVIAHKWRAECKARSRGQGFATIEAWLGVFDLLVLRRDRGRPLFVVREDVIVTLLSAWCQKHGIKMEASCEASTSPSSPA